MLSRYDFNFRPFFYCKSKVPNFNNQVPVQSHGESNQPEPVPLFPSGAASASERRRQFMSSDAYVQASDEHIYAATDNGHIVMIRLADVLNPPLMTEQYTNQFGNDIADRPATMYKNIERQIVKIDAVAKRDYEERGRN